MDVHEIPIDVVRQKVVDEMTAARLADTFKALSDSTRVRIISALAERELCVHDLASVLDMSHSAVSHQLGTLREMRLVKYHKEGRRVFYTLDDDHIYDLFRQGIEHIRHE
ncbi:MAG TPA: transcriptional regulator [Chloroflexi bacterium]|nr:transcriptional regulator [Chloroflexota bacterium]